jgi:fusion and transport protein UGO1
MILVKNGIMLQWLMILCEQYMDSDSDESEAPSYFTPTTPIETPSHKPPRRPGPSRTNSTTPTPSSTSQTHVTITLIKSDSVLEVISQLWSKESAYGIWKGTNSTFIYGILLKTIETWTTSCLSALLSVPDPTLLNAAVRSGGFSGASILDSPSPFASVGVVVAAAGIAGCLLAPIDMVRTR